MILNTMLLGRLARDGSPGDNLDRLFGYDAVGNRLSQQKSDNSDTTNYNYEANSNRLSQVNTTTIQRDNTGNTLNDGVRQYQYNAMNRLHQVINSDDGIQANYQYNFLGQRASKQLSGSATAVSYFVYGRYGELLGEYDTSGSRVKEYLYHYQANYPEPIAHIDADGAIHYIHTDHLGTPRLISDSDKTILWRWVSDAFGNQQPDEDTDGDGNSLVFNLRFPGQYFDQETGLHYNYFRYYDPSTGRYVTSDPIGLEGGINTYGYVEGNPILYIDPFGLATFEGFPGNSQAVAEQALQDAKSKVQNCPTCNNKDSLLKKLEDAH
jgi:RHS repeat-associated protein